MLRDWICRLLARMSRRTRLGERLHTILCRSVEKRLGGLYLPRYGLIAAGDRLFIWEVPNQTPSVAYMTKASKAKLRKLERAGDMKSSTEEDPHKQQLERSVKAKIYMVLLLLLLLLFSLIEESLYRTLKEIMPSIPFNMKISTSRSVKPTAPAHSDGSTPLLPLQ